MKRYIHPLAAALPGLFALTFAWGSDIGARFPPGSIADRETAATALREADAEYARIEREFAVREAECYRRFLVNRCRDQVRNDREAAERELRRVRLEARDTQRRLEAEDMARRREIEQARAAEREAAARPEAAAQPGRAASQPRAPIVREAPRSSARTAEDEAASAKARAEAEARYRERLAEAERRAAQSGENLRAYQLRQEEAARAAAAKEEERRKSEERRAERRRKMQEAEARREEIRQRAAEAARAAGR